jgi:hypothetical protein
MENNYIKRNFLIFLVSGISQFCLAQVTQTFAFTGSMQTFTVPNCVSSISLELRGAQGANAQDKLTTNSTGGLGGRATGVLAVSPGQVLNIFVGGVGNTNGSGGFNGGASGGTSTPGGSCFGGPAGGGGGASDIRVGGVALSNRLIVAGGGGGSGRDYCNGSCQPCGCGGSGGAGGGLSGNGGQSANNCGFGFAGLNTNGAGGGSGTAGGAGGVGDNGGNSGSAGSSGNGGNGAHGTIDVAGGGGGGGYYGGGGGGAASNGSGVGGGGGGGGSSYVGGTGISSGATTASIQTGNGLVILTYNYSGVLTGASSSPTVICTGNSATLTANSQVSYTWLPGNASTSNIIVSPTVMTSYTVSATNAQGCVSSAVVTVSVDTTVPSLTVANTASALAGVCPSNTVALTASGATTYTWTGAVPVTNGVAFSPSVSSGYTVSGQNACGVSTAVTSVSVYPAPSITVSASQTSVCSGNTVMLTASGASNYTWTGGISNGIAFTPSVTDTYSVSASNGTCTTMASQPVTVVSTPSVPPVASSMTLCTGKSVTITASGAAGYTWMPGPFNTTSITNTPSATTTFTLQRANGSCTNLALVTITVYNTPTVGTSVSQSTVCSGNSVIFAGTGANTYLWFADNNINPGNGSPYFPFTTQNYTVLGTSAQGCTNTAVTGVTVVTTPLQPPIATPTRICIGSFGTITATGASNYSWAPTGTFVGSSVYSIAVNPTITTTYTITKWNANCINTQTIELFVNNLPVLSVQASPTVLCAGKPSTLQVGGAINYTWTSTPTGTYPSGPNANFIVVNPPMPTEYTFVVTAHDGTCVNTETLALMMHPNPTITIANTSTRICIYKCTTFTLGGGTTYTWVTNPVSTPPQGSLATICPTTTTNYSISATNYTITAPNATLGCTSSREQVVQVDPLPVISTTVTRPLVCIGGPSTLITVGSPGPVVYNWNTTATSNSIIVNPQVSSCYVVTVTTLSTPSQCKDTRTLCVNVFSPTFAITPSTSICYGGSITLTVGAATSYTWINPPWIGNSVLVSPTVATVYSVAATSISNNVQCVSTNSVLISIYNQPTVTAIAERTTICKGDQVNLIASGGQTYEWRYFANNFLNSQNGTTITVSPVAMTTYTIYGTDQYGCKDTTTMIVLVSSCPGFVETGQKMQFSVYPNPTSNSLMISSEVPLRLTLFNAIGQEINRFELNAAKGKQIQTEKLAPGVYYLRNDADGEQVKKIIVER